MVTQNEARPDTVTGNEPAALARIAADRRVVIDVRAMLRAGEEPFSRIMTARQEVPAGGALAVRAIFEPVPLYTVMRKQGFAHWTEELAPDDWRVWFYPEDAGIHEAGAASGAGGAAAEGGADDDDGVVVLDVRGLEPPEPMVRTLAALERLPQGDTLVQVNVRTPQFLLPMLEERGFTYEVRAQAPDLVRVFIRHRSERAGR